MSSKINPDKSSEKCGECGSSNLEVREKTGETICNDCGLIIGIDKEDGLDDIKEDSFNSNLIISKFITTSDINLNSRDFRSKKRHLVQASQEMSNIAKELDLDSESYETACELYADYFSENPTVKSIEKTLVACIHLGAKKSENPLIKKKLSRETDIDVKDINKYERKIIRELNISPVLLSPLDYLNTVSKNIEGVEKEDIEKARNIIKASEDYWRSSGKSPVSITCAAIYLALKDTPKAISQSEAAAGGHLSAIPVRNAYKELEKFIEEGQKEIHSFIN